MNKEHALVKALNKVVAQLDNDDITLGSIQAVKDSERLNGNSAMIEVQLTVLVNPASLVPEHFETSISRD